MQKLLPSKILFFSILPYLKGFHPYECPCMPPLPLKPSCGHPFTPILCQCQFPNLNQFILTFAEYLCPYLMLAAEVELVIALTSKKLLKLKRPNWNRAQMHPPQDKQCYLQVRSCNNPKFFEPKNSSAVVSSASRWPDYF